MAFQSEGNFVKKIMLFKKYTQLNSILSKIFIGKVHIQKPKMQIKLIERSSYLIIFEVSIKEGMRSFHKS